MWEGCLEEVAETDSTRIVESKTYVTYVIMHARMFSYQASQGPPGPPGGISSTSRLQRGLGCLALATSHKQLPRHAFGTHHRPWLFSFGLTHGPCDTRSSTACLAMCSLMIAAHGALHLFPSGETKVLPEPRGDRYLVVAPEIKNSAACITQPTYLRPTAHSALQLSR